MEKDELSMKELKEKTQPLLSVCFKSKLSLIYKERSNFKEEDG